MFRENKFVVVKLLHPLFEKIHILTSLELLSGNCPEMSIT